MHVVSYLPSSFLLVAPLPSATVEIITGSDYSCTGDELPVLSLGSVIRSCRVRCNGTAVGSSQRVNDFKRKRSIDPRKTMVFSGNNARASFLLLLAGVTQLLLPGVTAKTYDVTASGDGDYDLAAAMLLAEPGDTVSLADGTYDQAIVSERDGEPGNPITVVGGRGAIINGDYRRRSVLITHSFITLKVCMLVR